jgi:hypothetical protein
LYLHHAQVLFGSAIGERDRETVKEGQDGLLVPQRGVSRTAGMSRQIGFTLKRLETDRKAETLRRGRVAVPPFVFCTKTATPFE